MGLWWFTGAGGGPTGLLPEVATLTALTLASEVIDWEAVSHCAGVHGVHRPWCPASTPAANAPRGHITKAGPEQIRTTLIESAWSYRLRPAIGVTLRRRQDGAQPDTLAASWKAQRRPHSKYQHMTTRGRPAAVAIVAVASELAGFLHAEMTR